MGLVKPSQCWIFGSIQILEIKKKSYICRLYVFIYIGAFYESLSSFHDIETNCSMAMKATLLINSSRMAFYLLAFDVRHLCKGYGRMQSQGLSLQGSLQIAC